VFLVVLLLDCTTGPPFYQWNACIAEESAWLLTSAFLAGFFLFCFQDSPFPRDPCKQQVRRFILKFNGMPELQLKNLFDCWHLVAVGFFLFLLPRFPLSQRSMQTTALFYTTFYEICSKRNCYHFFSLMRSAWRSFRSLKSNDNSNGATPLSKRDILDLLHKANCCLLLSLIKLAWRDWEGMRNASLPLFVEICWVNATRRIVITFLFNFILGDCSVGLKKETKSMKRVCCLLAWSTSEVSLRELSKNFGSPKVTANGTRAYIVSEDDYINYPESFEFQGLRMGKCRLPESKLS